MDRILYTVTKIDKTKAGKPYVCFNNAHGFKDMVFLGKTMPPPLGAVIEAEMTSLSRDDGSRTYFLNKYEVQQGQPLVSPAKPPESRPLPMNNGTAPIGASPPMSAPSPLTEPELRFISNCVGSAIMAKTAVDPVDVLAWATAALEALRNLQTPKGSF